MHRRAIRLGAAAFLVGLGARIDSFATADPWGMHGVPGFVASIVLGALSLLLLGLVLRAPLPVMRGAPKRSCARDLGGGLGTAAVVTRPRQLGRPS